jgi:hypothetical protein
VEGAAGDEDAALIVQNMAGEGEMQRGVCTVDTALGRSPDLVALVIHKNDLFDLVHAPFRFASFTS